MIHCHLNCECVQNAIKHDRLCKLCNHFFYADEFVFCHHFPESSKTSFFALIPFCKESSRQNWRCPLSFQLLIPKPSFEKWYVSETFICWKIQTIFSVETNLIIFSLLIIKSIILGKKIIEIFTNLIPVFFKA